jgi:hypothetical protein
VDVTTGIRDPLLSRPIKRGFFASLSPLYPSSGPYADKDIVKIAGVEIGLPTVELAYQDRSDHGNSHQHQPDSQQFFYQGKGAGL